MKLMQIHLQLPSYVPSKAIVCHRCYSFVTTGDTVFAVAVVSLYYEYLLIYARYDHVPQQSCEAGKNLHDTRRGWATKFISTLSFVVREEFTHFTNVAVVSSPSFSSFNGFMRTVRGTGGKLQKGDDGGGGALVSPANRTVQFHSSLKMERNNLYFYMQLNSATALVDVDIKVIATHCFQTSILIECCEQNV
uniref:Uncharacterized protein n=1 Tax=Glossina austeni TaxID=7395 RepID=A0A1A9UYP4_GLOAU